MELVQMSIFCWLYYKEIFNSILYKQKHCWVNYILILLAQVNIYLINLKIRNEASSGFSLSIC